MKLSKIIFPNMNVSRSVNLERDHGKLDTIKYYQVTAKTLEIMGRFNNALDGEKINAWSLTGPYGMGKSAFVNYLLAVTGPPNKISKIALQKLKDADNKLYSELSGNLKKRVGKTGFFQVSVTAAYEPVNNTLAKGLKNAFIGSSLPDPEFINRIQSLGEHKVIDSQKLTEVFQLIYQLVKKPMLIVIDEFGKNLDYMSHHHGKGDIFILQQLAEMESVYFWVCLHQAFDEYASGLSKVQKHEWSKIQGRFEDISFIESNKQMLFLMKNSLRYELTEEQRIRIRDWSIKTKLFINNTNLTNVQNLDEETIASIYPIHPVTAIALIELCRKFAQHDRTLLSFMCSRDRYALPSYLDSTDFNNHEEIPALGLEHLYDYFFNASISSYINRAESQRWIEIHDIINNAGYLTIQDDAILKNIGVLNLLGGSIGIKASADTILAVMESSLGINKQKLKESIDNLVDKGILLYRSYAKEYRLWEGSDIDIYAALREKKAKLSIGSLDNILQKYLPLSSVIASRHSYESGTTRRFERRWMDIDSIDSVDLVPLKGFDGLYLYCYGTLPEPNNIPKKCSDGRPLLAAYSPSQVTIHELALEAAAARSVLENTPELAHDSVARKEIKFRIKVAEEQFREHLAQLYSPGSEDLLWYTDGIKEEIKSPKELSSRLSKLCDYCYYSCPHVGNEMISYENLSGAAAAARRELIEAMATNASEEGLGLKGFGPEVAVYRSLLLAEGLHVKDEKTSKWSFSLKGKDPRLASLWKLIDDCIRYSEEKGVSIDRVLELLQSPPFGLRQGPAPIYIFLYIMAESDDIAVFQEGTYKPYITASEAALMLKRPELFVLKKFVYSEEDKDVFEIYRSILNTIQIEGNQGLRNTTMLGVVGPLIKFENGLTSYAKNTRVISREAQQVRSAIQNSTDPISLLFEELPQAVGINLKEPIQNKNSLKDELRAKLRSALLEISQAHANLIKNVETAVLDCFVCNNLQELYEIKTNRIAPLMSACDDIELKSFLNAFLREYREPAEWIKAIAGIITLKPVDSWEDEVYEPFVFRLRDYVERLHQLETLFSVNNGDMHNDVRIFSFAMTNGSLKREAINVLYNQDSEVQNKVNEILKLPEEKSKAILAILAEKLLAGDR